MDGVVGAFGSSFVQDLSIDRAITCHGVGRVCSDDFALSGV